MAWYGDEYVESTVTQDYVLQHLPKDGQRYVSKPLAFGHGLTDLTYGEWIISKGQRLFLILQDIGCSERIFDLVDRSVDDSDIPFPREEIPRLGLANASQEKKFYSRQFVYKVRTLHKGEHIDYSEDDVVPLESMTKSKGLSNKSEKDGFERVSTGQAELTRWNISLSAGSDGGGEEKGNLINYYKNLQKLFHPNLVSVFATYTHQNQAHVLLNPSVDMSLKGFLEDTPKSFKQMTKLDQLDTILHWIRCLSSAVAYLHQNGWAHQAIRPSNIFITSDNTIVLGPQAAIGVLQNEESAYSKGEYEYGAPEQWEKDAVRVNSIASQANLHSRNASTDVSTRRHKPSLSSTSSIESLRSHAILPKRRRRLRGESANRVANSGVQKGGLRTSASFPTDFDPLEHSKSASPRQHTPTTESKYANPWLSAVPASTPFQSDVFSLSTVIIELLSLFASICHSSNKYSPASARNHLSTDSRARGAYHSDISGVQEWLDGLLHAPEPKYKKLPGIITRNLTVRNNSPNNNDVDYSRHLGALASFVRIIRHGIERMPGQRSSALECLTRVDETLRLWGISEGSCTCFNETRQTGSANRTASPMSTQYEEGSRQQIHVNPQKSSLPSDVGAEEASALSAVDPDYQLPALTYSPSPINTDMDFPSRPPTPPPKPVTPTSSPMKTSKPKPLSLLAKTNADVKAVQILPPTPSSTLFHPTVYELAAATWDSDAETTVPDSNSTDFPMFNGSDPSTIKKIVSRQAIPKDPGSKKPTKRRADPESVIIALEHTIPERTWSRKQSVPNLRAADRIARPQPKRRTSERRHDSERIRAQDMLRDGEMWWKPAIGRGPKRDEERIGREYARMRRGSRGSKGRRARGAGAQ